MKLFHQRRSWGPGYPLFAHCVVSNRRINWPGTWAGSVSSWSYQNPVRFCSFTLICARTYFPICISVHRLKRRKHIVCFSQLTVVGGNKPKHILQRFLAHKVHTINIHAAEVSKTGHKGTWPKWKWSWRKKKIIPTTMLRRARFPWVCPVLDLGMLQNIHVYSTHTASSYWTPLLHACTWWLVLWDQL